MESLATVVGVDGSAASMDAVRWAVLDARLHRSDLRIVSSIPIPRSLTGIGIVPESTVAQSRSETIRILDEAFAMAAKDNPTVGSVAVDTVLSHDPAAATLLGFSRTSRMIVVGNRGMGGTENRSLGSIGFALTTHALCPVTVARSWPEDVAGHPINSVVVGVDGTRASAAAVALAFEEAALRSAPLTAVHSWSDADLSVGFPIRGLEWQANRPAAADQLDRILEPSVRRYPSVSVRHVVVKDRPVQALLDHAQGAQLLVMGSHGRGGYGEMMLGSTSRSVLARAHCPVIVVPSPARTNRPAADRSAADRGPKTLRTGLRAGQAETMSETIQVQGAELSATIKKLLHDGNIRRIVVKHRDGHTIIEIPVTAGVAVAIFAPVLVAVAAIAAVVEDCTIEVHRIDENVPAA